MKKLSSQELEVKLRDMTTMKEPEWEKAGKGIGIQVWRIENLKVTPWPKEEYGRFFSGDSYIVLETKLNLIQEIEYIAYVWIGNKTSKDEAGTATYKAMELDEVMGKRLTIIYEQQGNESHHFLTCFPMLTIIEGGHESEFQNVNINQYRPKLFQIHGKGKNVISKETPINVNVLISHDVFILDAGLQIYNWRGKSSNSFEKYQGALIAKNISDKRNGKPEVITIEQGEDNEAFMKILKDYQVDIPEKTQEEINANRKMLKLSDEDGSLGLEPVEYSKNSLDTKDAFLIDRGDGLIIWVGKGASKSEKRFANVYAKKYLAQEHKEETVKIILVHEGKLQEEIDNSFN